MTDDRVDALRGNIRVTYDDVSVFRDNCRATEDDVNVLEITAERLKTTSAF
jgi:hypothetical protein